jgi:hypothetical protein
MFECPMLRQTSRGCSMGWMGLRLKISEGPKKNRRFVHGKIIELGSFHPWIPRGYIRKKYPKMLHSNSPIPGLESHKKKQGLCTRIESSRTCPWSHISPSQIPWNEHPRNASTKSSTTFSAWWLATLTRGEKNHLGVIWVCLKMGYTHDTLW